LQRKQEHSALIVGENQTVKTIFFLRIYVGSTEMMADMRLLSSAHNPGKRNFYLSFVPTFKRPNK